jgi:hypothetical protein
MDLTERLSDQGYRERVVEAGSACGPSRWPITWRGSRGSAWAPPRRLLAGSCRPDSHCYDDLAGSCRPDSHCRDGLAGKGPPDSHCYDDVAASCRPDSHCYDDLAASCRPDSHCRDGLAGKGPPDSHCRDAPCRQLPSQRPSYPDVARELRATASGAAGPRDMPGWNTGRVAFCFRAPRDGVSASECSVAPGSARRLRGRTTHSGG